MIKWLFKNLYESFAGLLIFLLGFIIGTGIDIVFFSMYRKWDSSDKNRGKLIILTILQLFIIFFIVNSTSSVKALGSIFPFGLMSSQVFLFVHAIETISHGVFDRQS